MPRGKMTDEQKRKISEANKKRHAEKRAQEENAKKEPEVKVESLEIETEMNKLNQEGEDLLRQKVIQDAIAAALAQLEGKSAPVKRVDVSKCTRHPHVDVKPGENCEKCISATLRHNEHVKLKNYVLPCPKCKNDTREERGGTIKTFYNKNGHFSCGNCQLDYNVKGEVVTWDSGKSNSIFNKELVYRKNRL